MTRLSVNLNKIALLRNSRGRDYPSVAKFAERFIELGAGGITVHPRQDERHTRRSDVYALAEICRSHAHVEFNIEGYPSQDFLDMVCEVRPDQCTLVPDSVDQITSDHGWDVENSSSMLFSALDQLRSAGIRSSLFVDPDPLQVAGASNIGADRVELYTELYASSYDEGNQSLVLCSYQEVVQAAQLAKIGVNAGHDLNLQNLPEFLAIGSILEVSIGHALTIECIEYGIENVMSQYLQICSQVSS